MPELSVVVPLYNEEEVIHEMYRRLTGVLGGAGLDYELVLVNDGSRDRTIELAREICAADQRVKLLSFSRNFGHQTAITAGVDRSAGDAVVVIDADLQDPPEVIPEMVAKWREGFQVVYGVRKKREGESWFKLATAAAFYRLLRRVTDVEIPVDTGDFRLIDRRVVQVLTTMQEKSRFVRGMVSWVGFRQTKLEYVRQKRFAGETKYPFKKMLKFAIDGMLSFSSVPLKFASTIGAATFTAGVLVALWWLVSFFVRAPGTASGWLATMAAVLVFGGLQMVTIGILGEYIGRIYDEAKHRPLYIISEEHNFQRP